MSADRIVELCWWYLDHLGLFLVPAAIFDLFCWIAIGGVVYRRRRRGTNRAPAPLQHAIRVHSSGPGRT